MKHRIDKPLRFWIEAYRKQAESEGWDLFDGAGILRIEKVDDTDFLVDDQAAMNLVVQKALAGSKMHALALLLDGKPVHQETDLPATLEPGESFKFEITESDDDGTDIYLGAVESPAGMSEDDALTLMEEAWGAFKESEPEADSDFIEWLVDHHGFIEAENHFKQFTVQG